MANILNEEGYLPLKGKKFTLGSVCQLLGVTKTNELLTPRAFIEQHLAACSGEKPSLQVLALILRQNGYATPRGNTHWWPAQVRELLAGRFDGYYKQRGCSTLSDAAPRLMPRPPDLDGAPLDGLGLFGVMELDQTFRVHRPSVHLARSLSAKA